MARVVEKPTKLLEVFEKHCIGETNEVYERYVFNRRQQEPGESFDTFLGDLRTWTVERPIGWTPSAEFRP